MAILKYLPHQIHSYQNYNDEIDGAKMTPHDHSKMSIEERRAVQKAWKEEEEKPKPEYNGSGWNSGATMVLGRAAAGSCGTQTAAVFFCGRPTSAGGGVTNVEEYNGTSWTAGEAFPEGRSRANC